MKNVILVIVGTLVSTAILSGGAYAATNLGVIEVDSLKVGKQGVGGVTYFNGTIVNETTGDNNENNPVTFGDNVRIDGRVYRGATSGSGDSQPFIVNDDMEIAGSLTVNGSSVATAASFSTINSTLSVINTNVGTTNDSVGNAISSIGTSHNVQVDSINQLVFHAALNCINTQFLTGGSLDTCEDPIFASDLVQAAGSFSIASSNIYDSPEIIKYRENYERQKQALEAKME